MSGAPLPRSLERLIEALSRLPGVGPRTAERLAFHILRTPLADAQALAAAISAAREQTRPCEVCGHVADEVRCRICMDDSRDTSTLCVVEEPLDLIAIERTGAFRGRYHVLNGALSPMAGVGPGELRMRELFERVAAAEAAGSPIREVIIATNPRRRATSPSSTSRSDSAPASPRSPLWRAACRSAPTSSTRTL